MKPHYNGPVIKLPSVPHCTPFKDIISLFDVNVNVRDLNHGIVLNLRFDANQLTDLFRSIASKSYSEDSSLADQKNECQVKELTGDKKDLTPGLWIDDENHLTSREVEIMERLSKGRNYKEIADELGIKFNTVSNHLQHIYPKFGAGNRSEASLEYLKSRDKHKKLSSGG